MFFSTSMLSQNLDGVKNWFIVAHSACKSETNNKNMNFSNSPKLDII